jgi:hypothetical protein
VPGANISSGHNSPRPPLVATPKTGGSPAPRLGDAEKAAGAGIGGRGGAGVLVGKHLGASPSPRSPAVHGGVGLAIDDLPSKLDLKHATSPRSQASPRDAGSPASVASPRKEKVPSKWDNATARYLARSKGEIIARDMFGNVSKQPLHPPRPPPSTLQVRRQVFSRARDPFEGYSPPLPLANFYS